MNTVEPWVEWRPTVLARERLDERRWAYLIHAPFDTGPDIPELIGITVHLDGLPFQIRGIVPRVPQSPVRKGEVIGLLVRSG
jgi:hypothetical protein